MCNNNHALIRKYGLNICRQCFREKAADIGFVKVGAARGGLGWLGRGMGPAGRLPGAGDPRSAPPSRYWAGPRGITYWTNRVLPVLVSLPHAVQVKCPNVGYLAHTAVCKVLRR